MNTRRHFFKQLAGIGAFMILPGAGRIWKACKPVTVGQCNQQFDSLVVYRTLPYYMVEATRLDLDRQSEMAWNFLAMDIAYHGP